MAPNKLADLLLVHVYLCPPSVNLVSKALSRITRAWTPFRRAEDMFGKRPHPLLKKNFMAPFYGWGSTASRLEPLRGGSLLFTTKFPEVPGTHSIDLGRMKG